MEDMAWTDSADRLLKALNPLLCHSGKNIHSACEALRKFAQSQEDQWHDEQNEDGWPCPGGQEPLAALLAKPQRSHSNAKRFCRRTPPPA